MRWWLVSGLLTILCITGYGNAKDSKYRTSSGSIIFTDDLTNKRKGIAQTEQELKVSRELAAIIEEYRDKSCAWRARDVYDLAKARDKGVLLSKQLATLRAQRGQNPDPKLDRYYTERRALVLAIYRKSWMTPEYAQQQAEIDCIKK